MCSWEIKEESMQALTFFLAPIILFILATSGCKKDDNPLSPQENISSLSGTVVDAQGNPVEGCGVHYIYTMTTSPLSKVDQTCPSTSIQFTILTRSKVTLKIFRCSTRDSIATLVDDTLDAGSHMLAFDASKVTNGIYVYQLRVDTLVQEHYFALNVSDVSALVQTRPLVTTNSSGAFKIPYGVFGFGIPFALTSSAGLPIETLYVSHALQMVLYKSGYAIESKTITIDEVRGMNQTFTLTNQ